MIALIEVAGERTGLLTQLAVLASSTPVNPFDCDNRNLTSNYRISHGSYQKYSGSCCMSYQANSLQKLKSYRQYRGLIIRKGFCRYYGIVNKEP